jgi:glycosyltransferase involved in cell wall biosynthesis
MKIAVMLRAMDQDSGFRAYVEGLVENLLAIDRENSYLLYYRTRKYFGRFSGHSNVTEVLLSAPHKFAWDQIAVPYRAWKDGADVVFNPKFSVPLISPCPVTMGLQEPDWWVSPEYYERFDVLFTKVMLPLYCRKAAHLFPMSRFNLEESRKYLGLPLENASITYTCPGTHMKPITDSSELRDFRGKYQLPERFILAVTRVDHPGLDNHQAIKTYYRGKNPETILRSFMLCRDDIPHHLVFAGRRVHDYMSHLGFKEKDLSRVRFITFVPYEELPKLYNAADLSVMPAYYDGCSTTMMESMACGCPVIASRTGAGPEIGGMGALYADPHDPADFADKIRSVATDDGLRNELRGKALERAADFNWKHTAEVTLSGLRVSGTPRKPAR